MSVSVYYDACRNAKLTDAEEQLINKIIEKYDSSFPYKGEGENFYVYDYDFDEPEKIFSGATKLPNNTKKSTLSAIHWAACLTEIRRAIPHCEWYFALDDYLIPWDDEKGYYLPGTE